MSETAQNSVACAPSPATANTRLSRNFLVERYDLRITCNALLDYCRLHNMTIISDKHHIFDVCC